MKCVRCSERKQLAKQMCARCYYATKRGYLTYGEQRKERNFIRDGLGVLTDKHGKEWIVDLSEFEKCSQYLWIDNGHGYAKCNRVGYLHRIICPEWEIIDHIDRDSFNNKRSNLRSGENGVNSLNRKNSAKSGFKGVHQKRNKWVARVKGKYLGTFDTVEKAHQEAMKWAKKNKLTEFYII